MEPFRNQKQNQEQNHATCLSAEYFCDEKHSVTIDEKVVVLKIPLHDHNIAVGEQWIKSEAAETNQVIKTNIIENEVEV